VAVDVGKWVTDFERTIESEQKLLEELRAGRFTVLKETGRD
jgi:hypothetical protein